MTKSLKETKLILCADSLIIRELEIFLKKRDSENIHFERRELNALNFPFYDLSGEIIGLAITIVGIVNPLLKLLTDFQKTKLESMAKKRIRITVGQQSIELQGFSQREVEKLAEFLSQKGINND